MFCRQCYCLVLSIKKELELQGKACIFLQVKCHDSLILISLGILGWYLAIMTIIALLIFSWVFYFMRVAMQSSTCALSSVFSYGHYEAGIILTPILYLRKLISCHLYITVFGEGFPGFPCSHACHALLLMLVWLFTPPGQGGQESYLCQHLLPTQHLVYSRCLITICWQNDWMDESM